MNYWKGVFFSILPLILWAFVWAGIFWDIYVWGGITLDAINSGFIKLF